MKLLMSVGIRYESHDFYGETFKGVKQRNSVVLSFKEIFLVAPVGSPVRPAAQRKLQQCRASGLDMVAVIEIPVPL